MPEEAHAEQGALMTQEWEPDITSANQAGEVGSKFMTTLTASFGIAVLVSASVLWGQVKPQPSTNADYQKAYAEAFETSFRPAFRSKYIDNCSSSAPQAKAAGYDITPTCACAADTLLGTQTVVELQAISRDASSEVLKAVIAKCVQSHPPKVTSRP